MKARRVLITGATGFVGANLLRRLLRDGQRVVVALRPHARLWRIEDVLAAEWQAKPPAPPCETVECDIGDAAQIENVVATVRPEWIFHLATYGAYPDQTDRLQSIRSNTLAAAALAEACLRHSVGALVHAGSSSEYGPKDHAPSEDEATVPISAYGASKAAASLWLDYAARELKLPAKVLRLYSVYGPWEEPSRLVPTLLREALRGGLPPLADPAAAHDFLYVDDAVNAFINAAESPARGIFNIGSGRMTTLAELVALARELLPIHEEPGWGAFPSRPWDTPVWKCNPAKAAAQLGWRPTTSLRDGLARTIDWMKLRERDVK